MRCSGSDRLGAHVGAGHPLVVPVGTAAGQAMDTADDPAHAYDFGIGRLVHALVPALRRGGHLADSRYGWPEQCVQFPHGGPNRGRAGQGGDGMCGVCLNEQSVVNGRRWDDLRNLDWDWDKGCARPAGEVQAATALNAQFPSLRLVGPPGSGRGDYVGHSGGGRHFDHKFLPDRPNKGRTMEEEIDHFVAKNVQATIGGPYEPFIIIDSTTTGAQHRPARIDAVNGKLTADERSKIIWYPVGPGGAPTHVPPAATGTWDGPVETETVGFFGE